MIRTIVYINGIYDILCACSMLQIINIPILDKIHLSMIKKKQDPLFERFFAYWIFTYGIMRISNNKTIITHSYYIEAFVFFSEYMNSTVYTDKGIFVISSSLLLSYLSHLYI